MEPASALATIIGLSLKLGKAWNEDGVGAPELEAIKSLLDKAGQIRKASGDSSAGSDGDIEALHLALIAGAFGAAFRHHWAGWERYVPTQRWWRNRDARDRQREIEVRMGLVTSELQSLGEGEGLAYVDSLTGPPMATPFYRALWDAFTTRENIRLDSKSFELFIRDDTPSEIRSFQHRFLLAYWQGLATRQGRQVAAYLEKLKDAYRPWLVRQMMLEHMAGWGTHHVFGNVPRGREEGYYGLPFMPLDDSYVQPDAVLNGGEHGPILELLTRCLGEREPRIIIVKAHFGMGKSLTSRLLARDLAARYLDHPEADEWYPVLVKCARDFMQDVPSLPDVARRANFHMVKDLGVHDYNASNSVFAPPADDDRTLFILDGLDEVALSSHKLEQLFEHLTSEVQTTKHRIMVITRPSALTSQPSPELCHTIRIQPFDADRIADWLRRWNQLTRPDDDSQPAVAISPEMIAGRGLMQLAATPILLLMIATTWRDDDPAKATPGTRALLYERFFQQIAAGKSKHDTDKYEAVAAASASLRDKLVEQSVLGRDADTPDAMLWLMGRLAWEQNCLARTEGVENLKQHDVTTLIIRELKIRESTDLLQSIRMALLTVMQADLSAGADRFLFGHKSFREFLEARFWSEQLKRILKARSTTRRKLASELFRGRLMSRDLAAFLLLVDIVRLSDERNDLGWSEADREELTRWCEEEFEDARIGIESESQALPGDVRLPLRETALALRCTLGSPFTVHSALLRALIAGFWVNRQSVCLVLPGADLYGARLEGANLYGARLEGTRLEGARLEGANLERANLERANLERANLFGARLEGANLERANLERARLEGTRLYGANLERANLAGANLERANLEGARLERTNLYRARLEGANLYRARLEGANLEDANLFGANLFGANLFGARLEGANLEGANLEGATLEGANLYHTNLQRTILN